MNDNKLRELERQRVFDALEGISQYLQFFRRMGIKHVKIFSDREIYND